MSPPPHTKRRKTIGPVTNDVVSRPKVQRAVVVSRPTATRSGRRKEDGERPGPERTHEKKEVRGHFDFLLPQSIGNVRWPFFPFAARAKGKVDHRKTSRCVSNK
jgi:hypothetical protein